MEKSKNNRSVSDLSQVLMEWLRSQSYSEDQINKHRQTANRISKFMITNGISEYTKEVGTAFLTNYFSERNIGKQQKKRVTMIVYRLNDCADGYMPVLRMTSRADFAPLPDRFATVLVDHLKWHEDHGSKASTIRVKSKHCKMFLLYLANLGCECTDDITLENICKACLMFNDKNAWSQIRVFLKYLSNNGYIDRDYSSLVPHCRQPYVIPSVYTEDEISRLEAAIDRTSKTGVRDYAMLLLATRYGLRVGDIAKLSFKNLNFDKEHIQLVQEKTSQLWEAEMLPVIEDALLDYINNVRPDSDSDYVFLRRRAPYTEVGNSSIRTAMTRCFRIAAINTDGRKRGPHALRSSLASSMVNDDIPYEVVRRVLGHADPNAIKHYAKIDIERLREYAIPIPAPTGFFARFLCGEVDI